MSAKERAYGVRHGVYVHCFNQPERDYSVRHGVYVRCFNQSERDYIIIIIIRIHLLSANYHENVQMRYEKGYSKNYYMN